MRRIKIIILAGLLFTASSVAAQKEPSPLEGAWKSENAGKTSVVIFADGYFSLAEYEDRQFINTYGGSYRFDNGRLTQTIEYNAADNSEVGSTAESSASINDGTLDVNGVSYAKLDDGKGDLSGAWLITGRQRNGELNRSTPGARKTMKILSGSQFQWIAYNTETGGFFGTGGGAYNAGDGKYTEHIGFFSRDASRVGASLEFNYKIEDGEWHHSGKSSKGDPIYEIWTPRQKLEAGGKE